jgi:CheY-like chemotaxis protein
MEHGDRTTAFTKAPGRRSRFLLVVDSDTDNLSYTSMLLDRFNYQIFKATTAEEALQMATVAVPALILTALALKGTSGIELMQQLKDYPATAAIPVIVVSMQDDVNEKRSCFELGAVDCLYYPVSPELLYRAVQVASEKTPRTSMRIKTTRPVKMINMPIEGFDAAYTLELSERGLFLRTTQTAVRDMRLLIQLDLNGQLIDTEAVVVYNCAVWQGPYNEPGMGLQFVQLDPKDQERIRAFIMTEVMRDVTPGRA